MVVLGLAWGVGGKEEGQNNDLMKQFSSLDSHLRPITWALLQSRLREEEEATVFSLIIASQSGIFPLPKWRPCCTYRMSHAMIVSARRLVKECRVQKKTHVIWNFASDEINMSMGEGEQ